MKLKKSKENGEWGGGIVLLCIKPMSWVPSGFRVLSGG